MPKKINISGVIFEFFSKDAGYFPINFFYLKITITFAGNKT